MLGPDYIEHFTDAAQGAMDEYTLRLTCIYAALIGSIDFEGESTYSQAARKAALAAKDVQKAMSEEGQSRERGCQGGGRGCGQERRDRPVHAGHGHGHAV